jgi:Zn-dependent M28 family amino/carboxypeptidase
MELARAFAESGIQFDATLVFITWAGEEQGLVGSNVHAMDLKANNHSHRSGLQQRHRRQFARRQWLSRRRKRARLRDRS